jgi:uncharacterized protein (DUF1778 family)
MLVLRSAALLGNDTMAQTMEPATTRDLAINIRASRRQRDLIDQAAQVLGKSRSDFMLETACREAEDVLLDRAFFRLDPEAFARFNALLDNPPPPSDELRALLLRKAPWE